MIIILSPKEGREKKWNEARVSIHRPSTPANIRRSSYKFIKHSRRVLAEHAACVTNGRECISRRKNMQLYGVQSRHQVLFIGAAAYESGAPNLRVCICRRTQLATIIYQGRGGCNDRARADKSYTSKRFKFPSTVLILLSVLSTRIRQNCVNRPARNLRFSFRIYHPSPSPSAGVKLSFLEAAAPPDFETRKNISPRLIRIFRRGFSQRWSR